MCAYYSISSEYYRSLNNPIREIGQGNIVLDNNCRDKSYFIFKVIEAEELELNIINIYTNKRVEEIATAFVNNICFCYCIYYRCFNLFCCGCC